MAAPTKAQLLNCRYYDIDDFLADEELLPCTTAYDFALLAHLKTSAEEGLSSNAAMTTSQNKRDRHLPGNTKLQMPIWTMREWSRLNYVRIHVPKKYSSAARDSVKADPLHYELSESYFRSGKAIVHLLSSSGQNVEAAELQQTLLLTYTGPRMAKTLDWALSSGSGDDISDFLSSLTSMERRLYESGSTSKRRRLTK